MNMNKYHEKIELILKNVYYKSKHHKYIQKRINNSTTDELLNYIVDTFIYEQKNNKMCINFRGLMQMYFIYELANRLNIPFIEASAKDSTNVQQLFVKLTTILAENYSPKINVIPEEKVLLVGKDITIKPSTCC